MLKSDPYAKENNVGHNTGEYNSYENRLSLTGIMTILNNLKNNNYSPSIV
jgi:hypothetical protein